MLRSTILFAALSILTARPEAALLVDNFEATGKTNLQGGAWSTFHDSLSGAVSWTHAAAPGAGDSGHCGRMEDSISGSSGYAGVLTALSPDWKSVDLSAYAGVRLWARSNAAIFRLQLPITATNTVYNHYTKALSVDTAWHFFEVPFTQLSQEWGTKFTWDPTTLLQVVVSLWNASAGKVWAEVDGIEFYKSGEEILASTVDTSVFVSSCPKINQMGYDPEDPKVTVMTAPYANPGDSLWVSDTLGNHAWGTVWGATRNDVASSGEHVLQANITAFQKEGTWRIESNGHHSAPFPIRTGSLAGLYSNALRCFRSIRCGTAVHDERISLDHAPCHLQDTLRSDTAISGDFTGGWHNAGDFGKWVNEASLSVSSFLWLAELDAARSGRIPTGSEALLDEARWGLSWILKMQLTDGSMLHKVDPEPNFQWGTAPDHDGAIRWASLQKKGSKVPSSSDAAVAVAVFEQGARVFGAFDTAFAHRLSRAADLSWSWLSTHRGIGQTDPYYLDSVSWQEEFWALAERARATGSDSLRDSVLSQLGTLSFEPTSWMTPQLLGVLSVSQDPSSSTALSSKAKSVLSNTAQALLAKSRASGYRVALLPTEYWWESNENVLHRGATLLYGFLATSDSALRTAARAQLDYVLGQNSLDTSFVASMGTKAIRRPYHWSTMDYGTPLPGWVTGGPNNHATTLADVSSDAPLFELVSIHKTPAAKSYLDLCASNGSYASNEGETSEQAELVFLSGWFAGAGAWAIPQADAITSRQSRFTTRIAAVRRGGTWIFQWSGHGETSLLVRDLSGRILNSVHLDASGSGNWSPSHSGVFFISAPGIAQASAKICVP